MQHNLAPLCSRNSVTCFIPVIPKTSLKFQSLLLAPGMFRLEPAINDFTVLLPLQLANQRDVLIFSILIVVLISAGTDKLGIVGIGRAL